MHEVWVFLGGVAVGLVAAAGVLITLSVVGPKTPYPARGGGPPPGVGNGGAGPKESNLGPTGDEYTGVPRPRRRHRTMWDNPDGGE